MRLRSISCETSQGPHLQINEDSYDYNLEMNLFMIFDGFGGAGIGDKCTQELKEAFKKNFFHFSKDENATLPFFYSPRYLVEGNALVNAALVSHKKIYENNLTKETPYRAGASAIIFTQTETLLTFLSIGNCVAYLVRRGKATLLMKPDNLETLSLSDGESIFSTQPVSAFGLYPDLYYQIKDLRIQEHDSILLLTDGVYSRLHEHEISSVVTNSRFSPREKISELMKLANMRGNLDNQTALLCEY